MVRLFCIALLLSLAVRDIKTLEVPAAGIAALLGTVMIWTPAESIILRLPACAAVLGAYALTAVFCSALERDMPFGMGDALLFAVLSLQLDAPELLRLFAVSALLAGATAAVLLISRRAGAKSQLPYVPFIAAAYALSVIV